MKRAILFLIFVLIGLISRASTNAVPTNTVARGLIPVLVDSNNVVVVPSNFWQANNIASTGELFNLQSATNDLNSKVVLLEGATNNLNSRAISLESATNSLQSQIDGISAVSILRYSAGTNVEVLANKGDITVSRTNSTFYFDIPNGTRLISAKMRVDGSITDGGVIYLVLGTNDMNNSNLTTLWTPIGNCFREDNLSFIPITIKPLSSDYTKIAIYGLGTSAGVIYNIRLGF